MTANLLAALALHVLTSRSVRPTPQAHLTTYGAAGLVTVSRAETRRLGIRKNLHAAAAIDAFGEVAAALLRPSGALYCSFIGQYDASTGCIAVAGCGTSGLVC